MTNATLSGSAAGALGRGNKVYGNNAYAIGSENTVGSATVTETTESNGDKIKKVTAGTVKGNTAGAFGYKNTITTDNSYVVGSNSTISADNGMVLGNSATVTGANGLALGNNTKVANDNAVAIGNGSETAAAVATPSATINGVTHNFTGTNPASTVSVGKAGMERTVTNVAAGRISATSTDAINGSQLFAVKTEVEKGVSYAGDVKAAAATDNKFTRKLGEQTNIVGGVTDATKLTDNNIGVVSNGTDTLNIKLAKTLTGLDSVTAGGTTINNGGLTVDGKNYVSPNGINANNQKITNVADGTNSNDAVNYGQLQNVINSIDKAPTVKAKDANVTVTEGTNAVGGKEYIVGLGNTINVGTAHPVTVDGNAGHVTGLQNTDWNVGNPVAVPGRAATEDQLKKVNDTVNANKDQIDKNKQAIADNKQNITTNAGNIANNTQNIAKNAGDIVTINKTIEKGLNFDGDSGATINKKLGDTVAVKGGATGTLSDNNIGVVSDGTGTLNVKLAKTLTGLDSVTAGDTTINNGGLTVGGKNYVSPNGINANDQKVTNVANGDVAPNSKDAVNGGQLHQVKQDLGDQITNTKNDLNNKIDNTKTDLINKGLRFNADNDDEKTNKLGSKVTVNGDDNITTEITQTGDDTKIALKLKKDLNVRSVTATDTVKAGDVTMGKQADGANPGNTGNYITGLDNKTWDPGNVVSGRAATEDQLKQALANQTATGLKFDANVGGVQTSKLGSTVIVQGEGKAADSDYSGENIKTFIKQDAATGNTTIDVKMSKNLKAESVKVGKGDNKDGVSITGPDVANGTDGKVGITGKDGKEAVSMFGKDGVGHIGLNGKDGRSADISAEKGDPDIEGNEITRIKYQDENGKTHQVATKDDGMKYGGDSGAVINKKLNEQVNVIGGITDASKLTTEDNLGVVSDGSNNLKVRMAKDLKGLETVTTKDAAGNTTVVNGGGMKITPASGNPVSLTKDGLDNGGNKITNVARGTIDSDAVNLAQLKEVSNSASAANTKVAEGKNIKVDESIDNVTKAKTYTVGLKDEVTLGAGNTAININGTTGIVKAGTGDNAVTINGTNGIINSGKVTINGTTGTVNELTNRTWNPKAITNGQAATEDQLKVVDNKIDTTKTEIVEKGLNFQGDAGTAIHKDLGQTLKISGGQADASKLSENNIGVVNNNGVLNVKLAKDLTGLNSVTTGATTINNNGLTIGGNTFVTSNGFNANDTQITNVKAGTEDNHAVNLKQLKEVSNNAAAAKTVVKAGKNINVTDSEDPLTKAKTYTVGLQDTVTLGSGNTAVNIDGTKGIVKAGEGNNAVTINGTNSTINAGNVAIDGVTGNINSGKVLVNGAKGTVNNLTNITWDADHITSGQAATEDQLKVVDKKITDNGSNLTKKGLNFKGDDATSIHKDLGETLDVVGGTSDKAKLSDNNIGVVSENGKLNVKLAKELTGLTSVTTGATTINNEGLTIGGKKFVTANGFDANNTQIKNVKAGTDGNDAVNLNQLNEVKNASNTTVEGSENINVNSTVDPNTKAKTYKVALKDNVTLGSGNNAININGTTGIVKAGDGANAVTINGTNGTINSGKVTVNGAAGTVNNLTNITWDGKNFTSGQAATEDQLKIVDKKITDNSTDLTKKGLNFQADSGELIHKDLGQTLDVVGGISDKAKLSDGNIGVVSENGKLNVKLAKDLTNLNSVTTGQTTINNDGLTINNKQFVTANGFNANNTQIKNVTAGVEDNDAVNVKQLNDVKAASNTKVEGSKNIDVDEAVDPTTKAKTYTVALKDTVTLGSGNTAVNIDGTKGIVKAGDGTNAVTINGVNSTINAGKVAIDGVTGNINAGKVLVNGANGTVNNLTNITWDPAHITSGQAATEDQLKVVDNKIDKNTENLTKKGLNFQADSGEVIHKDLGQTLDVVGGITDKAKLSDNNIGVVSENGKLNVKLAKDLTGLNSVTTGQTTINNNGLTIGGNTFVTNNGFNANNTQIKNVKAGTEDSDAVNLKQLNEVKAASDTKVKGSKNIHVEEEINDLTKAKTYTVNLKDTVTLGSGSTSVHFDGTTGIIRAGEGANAVNINGTNGTINSGKVTINGGSGTVNDLTNRTWDPNKITNGQAATEDQLKVVDNKIDKNTEDLTKKGLNFKGDSGEAIHKDLGQTLELKGGESDASKLSNGNIGVVNENGNLNVKLAKNLKGLDSVTVGSDPNKQVVLDDKGVSVGGKTYISNEGLNANNQKITNVAAGVNDTDAVNVQQLKSSMAAATTTVKAGDSGNTTVETTVNADKSKTYTVDIKKDLNLRSVITTTDDKKFSTVTNGVGVTSTDTLGNTTALTAGNVKVSDNQNNSTQTTAKGVLVDNPTKATELTADGVVTTDKRTKSTRTTADGMVVTSGMGGTKVTTTVSSNGVAITTPPAGQGSPKDGTGAVTLTKDGLNNGGNKVVNMASGYAEGEDINNIADNSSSLTNGANIGDLKKGIDGLKKAGLDFAGDKGEFHRDLGQKVTVKGGVTDESKLSTANNIGVISDNNGSLNVRLAKDITGINSITTMDNSGHTTVTNGNGITIKNNGGGSVSLTSSGLNNGGNKITNVAPGEISSTSTDAVNGSQLNRVANSMNNVVNEVRQVGAMSSALSALKPMAYDPYEPTQIMAGYGNYRGDSALALGVAHYKNESMMLHAGVAWAGSNSHMMANAGVTWKVGNRDGEAETADRYRKGPISSTYAMQRELAAMKAENQGLKGEVADLKAENEQMKANIAAMMARLGL